MTEKSQTRIQALIEVAEALIALELSRPRWNAAVAALQLKAKTALKMPSGNPNIAEAAEKGRAVRKESADDFAKRMKPIITTLRQEGFKTYRDLANKLNRDYVPAPTGGKWHAASVRTVELRKT